MYLAKARIEWGQTAAICCLIANSNRDPKRKRSPFKPGDFNPLASPRERSGGSGLPINRETMGPIAAAWTGKQFSDQPAPPLNLPRIERRPHE